VPLAGRPKVVRRPDPKRPSTAGRPGKLVNVPLSEISLAATRSPFHAVLARVPPTLMRRTPSDSASATVMKGALMRRLTGLGATASTTAETCSFPIRGAYRQSAPASLTAPSRRMVSSMSGRPTTNPSQRAVSRTPAPLARVASRAAEGPARANGLADVGQAHDEPLGAGGEPAAGAAGVDRLPGGGRALHCEIELVERIVRVARGVFDRHPGDAGLHRPAHVDTHPFGLDREPTLEVGVEGDGHRGQIGRASCRERVES